VVFGNGLVDAGVGSNPGRTESFAVTLAHFPLAEMVRALVARAAWGSHAEADRDTASSVGWEGMTSGSTPISAGGTASAGSSLSSGRQLPDNTARTEPSSVRTSCAGRAVRRGGADRLRKAGAQPLVTGLTRAPTPSPPGAARRGHGAGRAGKHDPRAVPLTAAVGPSPSVWSK
jgi:hypothetical protein